MTKDEKLVWAATYAAQFTQALRNKELTGVNYSVPTCVENAWAAVIELRENRDMVAEAWGGDSDVLAMLDEILG